ncbi:hypothetical protein GCM10023206_33890 [Acinetobacter puyangensis]|uniref:Excalibur calcium-binding domain-containing protein n=1 Tax=Acinetobacter puyangensis TaxID=1096779 RepID=A0A240EE18_9GAMM|nr:Excalibur calcium-binding domain-containing protein [Acinetobacter puyangensis]
MLIAAWYAKDHYQINNVEQVNDSAEYSYSTALQKDSENQQVQAVVATSSFSCDGRQHCSQMTSCAEATYFLRNCPGTKMDGNNDGIPCEKQWCK